MATQQAVPVTCPTCRNQFSAPIFPLINGEDLPMKSAFLQGRVNMAQCPSCGWVGGLNVPFLYYDMSKEFAFVFVPNALQMGPGEQDKIVGNLTNTLVNSLPTEQRKFYLLNPQLYLTLESLVKAVLEKDGITEEMIQAQEARSKLIEEFLQIADEATLKTKAEENDELLDREFFEILTAMMQASQHRGDQNAAQALFALRSLLARWSTQGKEAVAEIDAELGLIYVQNQEELLERLKAAETGEEFEGLIAAAYSLLDYGFFQKLTEKIDAATQDGEKAEAETLTALRAKVLDTKNKQEEAAREAMQKSADVLKYVLQSSNPVEAIDEKLDEIDESFFSILSANIQEAQRQNQDQVVQAMEMIGNIAITKLQERMAAAESAAAEGEDSQPASPLEQPPSDPAASGIHIAKR